MAWWRPGIHGSLKESDTTESLRLNNPNPCKLTIHEVMNHVHNILVFKMDYFGLIEKDHLIFH